MPIIIISPNSDNEAKKDRGNRHAPQNLTADHLTGLNYTGKHITGKHQYDDHVTGVPNLGGRQNWDHVATELAGGHSPIKHLNVQNPL